MTSLSRKLACGWDRTLSRFFGKATPEPGFEVDLKSALLTFSDPETYPTEEQVKRLRAKGFHISVGIRPKIDPSERKLDRLAKLLEMPEVCALGEIGIDHSVPIGRWASQTLNIQKILGCLAVRSNKIICDTSHDIGEIFVTSKRQLGVAL